MSKQSIKATIDANIKQNGNQEITGQIMNSVLNQMVDNLAEEASTTEKLTELGQKVSGINLASDVSSSKLNRGWLDSSGEVSQISTAQHIVIPVKSGQVYEIVPPVEMPSLIAFLHSYTPPSNDGETYDIIGSRVVVTNKVAGVIPDNTTYLWVGLTADGVRVQTPTSLLLDGVQYIAPATNYFLYNTINLHNIDFSLSETFIREYCLQQGCFVSRSWVNQATRVGVVFPIPVKKGEQIICHSYDFLYHPVLRDTINGNILVNWGEIYYPVTIPQDGYLYLYICKASGGDISIDEADGVVSIQRTKPNVEYIKSSWLVKGYINSDHQIAPHSTRFVNFRRIYANKGDLIYATNLKISFVANEYDNNGVFITKSSVYNASIPTPTGLAWVCSPYMVKNDGYVMLQCADIYDPSSINLEDYNNGICVIHTPKDEYSLLSNGVRKVTPISSKRGKILPLDNSVGRYIQNGTMVKDKLYVQYDDYVGGKSILVVNIDTGIVEKTINWTWEKHGGMSYNENNDILLVSNGGKLMFFKHPESLSGTISETDADLVISTGFNYGVIAWGENEHIVYWVRGYDGTNESTERFFQVDKLKLGMSNGEYDGTYTTINSFSGTINNGIDTYEGDSKGGKNFAQDAEFDGYLYVAFGGMSQNFLVLNLNECDNTFDVVGNYWWRYLDNDGIEHYLETELVTLYGSKIICGARNYSENISSIRLFERM